MGKKSRPGPGAHCFSCNVRFHFRSELTLLPYSIFSPCTYGSQGQSDVALVWSVTLTSQAEVIYTWNSFAFPDNVQGQWLSEGCSAHTRDSFCVACLVSGLSWLYFWVLEANRVRGQLWSDLFRRRPKLTKVSGSLGVLGAMCLEA